MKSIRNSFSSLAIIGGLIVSLNFVHAQTTARAVQSVSAGDMDVMLQAVEATTPAAAESVPKSGTFYSAQFPTWPPLPCNINNVPAWNLGDGAFLLNDLDVNYSQRPLASSKMAGGMRAMDGLSPGDDGDGGTNSYTFNASGFVLPDYGTNLWIAQVGISSESLVGIVSNSVADTYYELQSCENLLGGWSSEGAPVYGSEAANWTPFSVAMNNRTNLFVRIKSWADSTGSGIPDWWWLQYFGQTTNVDAYANPAGDGWNNLEKFQAGMNPNVFYTPPAPHGLTITGYTSNGMATVNWQPSPGPVTGYTIERTYYPSSYDDDQTAVFNVSANVNSLQDTTPMNSPWDIVGEGPAIYAIYKIQAHYAGGDSDWSDTVWLQSGSPSVNLIGGSQNSVYLTASALPSGTTALRVTRVDMYADMFQNDSSFDVSYTVPVSALTNGLYRVPESWKPSADSYGYTYYRWWVQTVNTDGPLSAANILSYGYNPPDDDSKVWIMPPYFDGRAQLKQNLIFLLREANANSSLRFVEYGNISSGDITIVTNPPDYEYSSFYAPNEISYGDGTVAYDPGVDVSLPFEDNYRYRNFVYNPTNVNSGGQMTTGVGSEYIYWFGNYGLILDDPLTYEFQIPSTSGTTITALLATNQTQWLCQYPLILQGGDTTLIGITSQWPTGAPPIWTLAGNTKNYWGLSYVSAKLAYNNGGLTTTTLSAGNSFQIQNASVYMQTAQPQFQTVEYDFWNPQYYPYQNDQPIPGIPGFSPTNTSRLMIAPVGGSISIAGYAKLEVTNSYYQDVYGYLGQYFDQAYQIDTNGIVTTNTTGVLSPYGSFFATEPGPAALVTMPDVDTGARGTCTVYCVSAQVDKNFDGTMDLSFNGPDATSQASPYRIWVNSGHDEPGKNGNLDKNLPVPPNSPNYSYGQITCQRDLENFFRLWVCGLPALPTSQGYTVTLSMSPSSGSPAINLYASYDTNGSAAYLTDTNAAQQQFTQQFLNGQLMFDYSQKLRTISSSQSYTLPVYSDGRPIFTHFLFEGAGIGEGQLTLTISQNGNTIAQTGVWLDLHDIKDFYERAKITNNISGSISNWTSGIEMVKPATSALGDDTNLIVFVHGINVDDWDWLDDSDTVFKRLYWAGYHGKFMTVKWPCNFLTPPRPVTFAVFNLSEANAYKSSTSLTTYLNQLRSRFSGYRLNLYAHSQGNAVASEAVKNGAPFDTYILTQGAISDGAYDVNATNYPVLVNEEYGSKITPQWQPMGYQGVYTNSNFSGKIVNFYNTNDPVLAVWIVDQVDLKPSGGYFYDGVNCRYTISTNTIVTDFQETRSMVSRSRSLSVGQSPPESPHGVITSAVDLNTRYGFNNAFPADHSAQWTWPIQTTRPYYLQILDSIKP